MDSKKLDLIKLSDSSSSVPAMLNELEGSDPAPQWPTRFITYQKLAPSREQGARK